MRAAPRLLLPLLLLTQFLVVLLDTNAVLALPAIQRDLGFSEVTLPWVQTAYMAMYGGFLLLAGRSADVFGRRGVLLGGLAVFTLATLACGLAGSATMLVLARAVQGLASAFASAAALSIVTVTYVHPSDRARALGVWGLSSGLAVSLGLVLGGVATDVLGWSWVFLLLLPFCAVALVGSAFVVTDEHRERKHRHLDVSGAVLGTAAVIALVVGVAESEIAGWGAVATLGPLAASAILLLAFVIRERLAAEPLLPLGVLRLRNLVAGNVATAVFGAVLLAMFALSSVFLQEGRGFSSSAAGLTMLALGVVSVLVAVPVARLVDRHGFRIVLSIGLVLLGVGSATLGLVGDMDPLLLAFLPATVVFGLGICAAEVAGMTASMDDLGHGRLAGLASGLWNSSLQVGGAVGLAVLATVMAASAAGGGAQGVVDGYRDAALLAGALSLAGALVVALIARAGRAADDVTTGSGERHCGPAHAGLPVGGIETGVEHG